MRCERSQMAVSKSSDDACRMMVAASLPTSVKCDWAAQVALQKAEKAAERARLAAAEAEKVRERAREHMLSRGLKVLPAAPGRTSTKGFGSKDPALAFTALGCLDIDRDMINQAYPHLNIVASKFCVRAVAERLAKPTGGPESIFASPRAAAMMATKAVRFVFEMACELAAADPDKYMEARSLLEWHDAQKMLKSRETRGVGVVMYGDAAKDLLRDALHTARERVKRKVDADAQYEKSMSATARAVMVC